MNGDGQKDDDIPDYLPDDFPIQPHHDTLILVPHPKGYGPAGIRTRVPGSEGRKDCPAYPTGPFPPCPFRYKRIPAPRNLSGMGVAAWVEQGK